MRAKKRAEYVNGRVASNSEKRSAGIRHHQDPSGNRNSRRYEKGVALGLAVENRPAETVRFVFGCAFIWEFLKYNNIVKWSWIIIPLVECNTSILQRELPRSV